MSGSGRNERRAILIGAAAFAAMVLLAVWTIAIPSIEDELTTRSEAALVQHFGADASALSVDFDGRDATVSGVLPAGSSSLDIGRIIGDLDGVRQVDVQLLDLEPSTSTTAPAAPEPTTPSTTVAIVPGIGHDVAATFDGEVVTLSGTVLSRDEAADLRAIANAEVGLDQVRDDMLIGGEATDESDQRSDAFGAYFGVFALDIDSAALRLTDDAIVVNVEVAGQEQADAVQRIIDTITAPVQVEISINAPQASVEQEIDLLQRELDGLRDEIAENVVFSSGTAELSDDASTTLDKVIAAMQQYSQPVVEVQGHTDNRGSAEGNRVLSGERAAAVEDYLIAGGIAERRVRSVGLGDSEPIGDNETSAGRLANRRVELVARATFDGDEEDGQ